MGLGGVRNDPWELIRRYRERYDISDLVEPGLSLERSLDRRKARERSIKRRIEFLESQIAEAVNELRAIEGEIEGSRRVALLFAEEVIDEVRRRFGEAWSPSPVLGFRMWTISHRGIEGATQTTWSGPEMVSKCLRGVPGEDIPHSQTRCGPPACGVYATKHLATLRSEGLGLESGRMLGVVEMTGKVIEHELGYRASKCRVVAVAAWLGDRCLLTDDPEVVTDVFRRPGLVVGRDGELFSGGTGESYLEQWKEKNEAWIWEKR